MDINNRNNFLLKDLGVEIYEISDIWPEPETNLPLSCFLHPKQYKKYLARLSTGIPWSAYRNTLVFWLGIHCYYNNC
jgi:hypothetical protein